MHNNQEEPCYSISAKPVHQSKQKYLLLVLEGLVVCFIITPLIVGFWRGTWTLMDIYGSSIPGWESFFFSATLNYGFAIVRDDHQNLIDNCSSRPAATYCLNRFYTYIFAITCIMQWRGGWAIFDKCLGVLLSANGSTTSVNVLTIMVVWGVLVLILVILKTMRNIVMIPFGLDFDSQKIDVHFPTRFRSTFLSTMVYSTTSSYDSPLPEKLRGTDVFIEKQVIEEVSPRPFVNGIHGDFPSGFLPSTYHPTINHQKMKFIYTNPTAPTLSERNLPFKFNEEDTFGHEDIFYQYKPQDPSDINLMSPNGYRFAPSALRKSAKASHLVRTARDPDQDNKLVTMMVHLYSSGNKDQPDVLSRLYNKLKVQDSVVVPFYTYGRNYTKLGNDMVMKLNVYPDMDYGPNRKYRQEVLPYSFQ